MIRRLATVRRIKEIVSIEGADNIELALVDGWQSIVKKGHFSAGDFCIYCEIDSFLPIRPQFEFLRKSSYRKMQDKEGFRLKTIRLRGQLSQGLILSYWATYPPGDIANPPGEGADVTEDLGIILYEPPIPAQLVGKAKGYFPSFIRKTDQERLQNSWNKIKDTTELFEVTVKLDGTSCTYYYHNTKFGVCSRNLELLEDETNTLWRIAREHRIEEMLTLYNNNIALQGEIIGEGIQGNPEKLKGQEFYLFDIFDIDRQAYMVPARRRAWNKLLFPDLKHVPILAEKMHIGPSSLVHYGTWDLKSLLDYANGPSLNPDSLREGIVFKGNDTAFSFKIISNEYLLKEGA